VYQQGELNTRDPSNSQLCPDYEGTELGIGESLLVKAIAESTGRNATKIKDDLRKEGDLGKVAMVRIRLTEHLLTPELAQHAAHHVQA
jgi:DNA ligase-1